MGTLYYAVNRERKTLFDLDKAFAFFGEGVPLEPETLRAYLQSRGFSKKQIRFVLAAIRCSVGFHNSVVLTEHHIYEPPYYGYIKMGDIFTGNYPTERREKNMQLDDGTYPDTANGDVQLDEEINRRMAIPLFSRT